MQGGQVGFDSGVLVELSLDIVVNVDQLLYHNFSRRTDSITPINISPTFCNVSISSAMGRSDRYLTLFQLNVRKYWSVGSVRQLAIALYGQCIRLSERKLTIVDHLVLRNLILIAFQDSLEGVGHPLHNTLTAGMELC